MSDHLEHKIRQSAAALGYMLEDLRSQHAASVDAIEELKHRLANLEKGVTVLETKVEFRNADYREKHDTTRHDLEAVRQQVSLERAEQKRAVARASAISAIVVAFITSVISLIASLMN